MPASQLLTEAEFLELEARSETKHEFYNGHVYAMAGGTYRHACISSSALVALTNALRGSGCCASGSDTMVKVGASGLMTYPDVMVACGQVELYNSVAILNPALLLEVLSDSTEAYDRGRKFMHCRQIPSLGHYILVAQDEMGVDHFSRQDDGSWKLTSLAGNDILHLAMPALSVSVKAFYEGVDFSEEQPLRDPGKGTLDFL